MRQILMFCEGQGTTILQSRRLYRLRKKWSFASPKMGPTTYKKTKYQKNLNPFLTMKGYLNRQIYGEPF